MLIKQIQDKFALLEMTQEEISGFLLNNEEFNDQYSEEFLRAEKYRDSFCAIISLLKAAHVKSNSVPKEAEIVQKRKLKLPKLELKKFDGNPKDFLAFWAQFEKIHKDDAIVDKDKLQYLLQCAVPESKAESLVSSFPPTSENYSKAISQLKERFGRDELLVQIYVRDLLAIVTKNPAGRIKKGFSELYDMLECRLMTLESLGRTKEKFVEFLEPLVESCLSETVL